MATQTKLILFNGFQKTECLLNEQTNWSEPIFSFLEYGRCDLTFESDDPTASLELEYMNEDGKVCLLPQDRITLADNLVHEEGYVPGNFSLKLKFQQECFEGFFTVHPQSINDETLHQMRELLESKANGITRNLYSQKLVGQDQQYEQDCLNLLTFLGQHQDELFQTLRQIERNPIESLEHQYELSKLSKKQTAKSQRWAATKGSRHTAHGTQQLFYEPKMRMNLDTPENRCLKHILYDLLNKTARLNEQYQHLLKELTDRHQTLVVDLERLKVAQSKSGNNFHVKKHQGSLMFEIQVKENELADYVKRIESHEECFKPVRALNAQLHYLLNETWIQQIPPIFKGLITQRLLKHRAYAYLYLVYQEINKTPDEGQDKLTFPYHQTSKLFEYYNVLLLVELLESQGFTWESGWLKDLKKETQTPSFHSLNAGEVLMFSHPKGYRIRLSYDVFLNNAVEAKRLNQEQLVSVNSTSRRPDILIELFEADHFLSAMIVEVKYRKLNSLYQELTETDVMKQLIDYRALNYYDPNRRPNLIRNAVDNIIVIYPNHEGSRFIHEESYDFKFIPLSPTGFSEQIEGVSLVKQSLCDFLNQSML